MRPEKFTAQMLTAVCGMFALAMVGLGAAFPNLTDLALLVFWYPQIFVFALLIPFSLDFVNRRFSFFSAALLATPSLMLLPALGFPALIFWGGLFLIGVVGILLAVIVRLGHELLRS